MKLIDLTGNRYGKLVVLCRDTTIHNARPYWKCKCDCGNVVSIYGGNLRSGTTTSCGCKRHERPKRYDEERQRIRRIWKSMLSRCYNENNASYKYYGLKGITVCDEWKNSFDIFYQWAKCSGYSADLSIDRIYNDKNYCPNNCRWSNTKRQNNNRSVSLIFTYKGKTQNLSSWCEELNLPYNKVWQRIVRLGYTFEQAITLPDYSYIRKGDLFGRIHIQSNSISKS